MILTLLTKNNSTYLRQKPKECPMYSCFYYRRLGSIKLF